MYKAQHGSPKISMNYRTGRLERMIFKVATTILVKYITYKGTFPYRTENIISLKTIQQSLKNNVQIHPSKLCNKNNKPTAQKNCTRQE